MPRPQRAAEPKDDAEADRRALARVHIVHETILKQGTEELERPVSALAWSGLAAGLGMGFSFVAEGLLHAYLPDRPWRPVITKLGYPVGFLIAILGRQQLFTENTLTAVIPLLESKSVETLWKTLRLWIIVLLANLAGAFVFATVAAHTPAFDSKVQTAFFEIGQQTAALDSGTALLRGIYGGWLIALVLWMLAANESGRPAIIIILTYLVALGGFTHIIAGSVEYFFVVSIHPELWSKCVFGYMVPTLTGNIIGGVSLVSALNHAQVVSGKAEK